MTLNDLATINNDNELLDVFTYRTDIEIESDYKLALVAELRKYGLGEISY